MIMGIIVINGDCSIIIDSQYSFSKAPEDSNAGSGVAPICARRGTPNLNPSAPKLSALLKFRSTDCSIFGTTLNPKP